MKLKRYVRYEMEFQGNWPLVCNGFLGLFFFLRIFYYFGLVNLQDIGDAELIFSLILPLLLSCTYLILFRIIKWNAPGIYAILGGAFCFLLLIWNFSSGDFLRILLSVLFYLAAAVLLLATAGGYLPGKLPVSCAFAVILLVRILFYSFRQTGVGEYTLELSSIFLLVSMLGLTRCFKLRHRQNT